MDTTTRTATSGARASTWRAVRMTLPLLGRMITESACAARTALSSACG